MNSDSVLYIKAAVLVGMAAFSVVISLYFIDLYFYHKLHDFYLSDQELNNTYDKSDDEVNMLIRTSATLKKEHFFEKLV